MAERFGPRLPNAIVFRFLLNNLCPALRLDARQFQLFTEDGGQFVERDVDFHQVAGAGIAARLTGAVFGIAALGNRLALFAVALSDAAGAVVARGTGSNFR